MKKIFKSKTGLLITLLFILLGLWWLSFAVRGEISDSERELFSDSYWIVGFIGGLTGLRTAKLWGGFKSIFGKSLSFFSLGLMAQSFGQVTYTFYARVLEQGNPYPSFADIGYFATIPLYIMAILYLAKACNIRITKASIFGKLQAFILPAALVATSYSIFLKNYEFDWSQWLTVLLDFGYPLGDALYIAFAVLTFLLSRKVLGGILRNKILLLLFALVVQYTADFSYLYQTIHETWIPGGLNDGIYLLAYFLTAMAIVRIGAVIGELGVPAKQATTEEATNG